MKNLNKQIVEYKATLETLYMKSRRGENNMEEVLALSRELDKLLIEKSREKGSAASASQGPQEAGVLSRARSGAN